MISVQHLAKQFGSVNVLRDVNADIRKGEIISIIGPSGTGKSTFLRCLNLLETPSAGQISINGIDILAKGADVSQVRQKMGMVFQSFNLFSHLMVIENILLGPENLLKVDRPTAYAEAMRLLGLVGLVDKAYAYPDELSGGQKQRVAIARALAMKPDIILLDEPTSALDPTMIGEVLAVLRNLARDGMTMMIVTHEMKFAEEISTRIFYMDEGIIYEEGPPAQIFHHPRNEKTRTFVHRIRTASFMITSRTFDFYALISGIEEFGRKQILLPAQIHDIQLVIEELVMNSLLPVLPGPGLAIKVTIGLTENNAAIEINLDYSGPAYNPFAAAEAGDLALRILSRKIRQSDHSFDATASADQPGNHLTLLLGSVAGPSPA